MEQDYDLSVCAFSPEAFSLMIEDANSMDESYLWRHIPVQLFEYLAPRKSSSREERSMVLNPLTLNFEDQKPLMDGDITQLIHEAFWRHNKDIGSGALSKLDNTERYLRAARARFSEMKDASERMMRFKKGSQIGIGSPIAEAPSHLTGRTDRVSGESAVQAGQLSQENQAE